MSWSAIVEMLGCMEAPQTTMEAEAMTVLERQQAHLKWQQQQQNTTITTVTDNCVPAQDHHEFTAATPFQTTNGHCREDHQGNFLDANVWPELFHYPMLGDSFSLTLNGFTSGISRTLSCPPIMGAAEEEKVAAQRDAPARQGAEYGQVCSSPMTKEGHGSVTTITSKSNYARKKRQAQVANHEADVESNVSKMMKGEPDGRAMPLKQEAGTHTTIINKSTKNSEKTSADGSKDASKASEVVQKPDYIHVRARRGQATDSHSLAERVRREKISERMKYLQELVPGCDRITGKAGMLDEIINYVQSLQRQVEFLSMKLATVNPVFDFDLDGFLTGNENIPALLSFNLMQHSVAANCGLDMPIDLPQAALRRTASDPRPVSDTLAANTCCDIHAALHSWDAELQDLQNVQFHNGKAPFQDVLGANNLKMET